MSRWVAIAGLCGAAAWGAGSRGDDAVVNTPVVLAALSGEWELQPGAGRGFRQRLSFSGGQAGQWHQAEAALPVSITYYVEGNELLVQHYVEKTPFNYRMRAVTFAYKLDGDWLDLTRGGKTDTWKRVPKPAARDRR